MKAVGKSLPRPSDGLYAFLMVVVSVLATCTFFWWAVKAGLALAL